MLGVARSLAEEREPGVAVAREAPERGVRTRGRLWRGVDWVEEALACSLRRRLEACLSLVACTFKILRWC